MFFTFHVFFEWYGAARFTLEAFTCNRDTPRPPMVHHQKSLIPSAPMRKHQRPRQKDESASQRFRILISARTVGPLFLTKRGPDTPPSSQSMTGKKFPLNSTQLNESQSHRQGPHLLAAARRVFPTMISEQTLELPVMRFAAPSTLLLPPDNNYSLSIIRKLSSELHSPRRHGGSPYKQS